MRLPIRFPRLGRRWIKPLVLAALVNVLLWQGATFATVQRNVLAGHADFISFYAASHILVAGEGSRLYDIETQQRWQQRIAGVSTPLLYYRPPFHLLLYLPLAPLSLEAAYLTFYVLNLVLLIPLAWVLADAASALGGSWKWLLVSLVAFFPVSFVLLQGQDSLVALLILGLVWRAMRDERESSAGVLLALLLFKLQIALPMVAAFALARRWRVLQGFAAGVVPVMVASVAVTGWRPLLGYPFFLVEMNQRGAHGTIHPWAMPNLRGLLESVTGNPGWTLAVLPLLALCLLLWAAKSWRDRSPDRSDFDLRFAMLMITVLLISHHQNPHDIALLALPLLLVSNHLASRTADLRRGESALAVVTAALFLPTLYVLLLRWRGLYLLALLLILYGGMMARRLSTACRKTTAQGHVTLAAETS